MPTDFIGRVLAVFDRYGMSMVQGAAVSLQIALVGTFVGCVIGFAVGIVQTIPTEPKDNPVKKGVLWIVKLILNAYVEFFRGTPMMAQAMFIYYGLFPLVGLNPPMRQAAYFILSINTGAYMAETVRGGILSIDIGQTEGAKAIGMTHVQTMLYVILPQALRNIMPQIGNNLIINIKDSCVLSVIGVAELLYKTKAAAGALYMNFETYTITMIMYFIMTFTCSRILRWMENRMDGSDNYDLATTDTLAHTSGMYRYPDEKKGEK
ncbi:MAG: amino acid ABC transporter permease [Lachnospiraceae bacterium]|nr:amino acid ABC transporter permease [Lachnospiraceae bacterium]MCI9185399.1 amino acid ABC transporter permease [Lachnospiraceae bacterium]